MSQIVKHGCAVAAMVVITTAYVLAVHIYLRELLHPALMMMTLLSLFGLECWRNYVPSNLGLSWRRIMAITFVFAIGAGLAYPFRVEYLKFMSLWLAIPDITALMGTEYCDMLRNKVVGYGGAYAVSVLCVRWLFGRHIERLIFCLWGDANIDCLCPHCNKPITS